MKTVKSKIQLDASQFEALAQESERRQMSVDELVSHLVKQHLAELALFHQRDQASFMSIIGLGKSGAKDVSEKHDQYLGEMISHEHLR